MKQLLVTIALLIPVLGLCQKHDVKNLGDKTELTFSGTYLVEKDTSESGVITIKLIPTEQLASELESKLGSLNGEEENLSNQISQLQDQRTIVRKEVKEIEKLIADLNKGRSVNQPKN